MLWGEHHALITTCGEYCKTNKQTKNVIPNAYFIQNYFHKLALLLILRELIGIYTVKTLLHRALLIMAMWGGETLCVSDTNHMVHIKKKP